MKIWELNKEKSLFECFKTIIFQKNIYLNILQLNQKEFLTIS